jgi:hypothetical protein
VNGPKDDYTAEQAKADAIAAGWRPVNLSIEDGCLWGWEPTEEAWILLHDEDAGYTETGEGL